MGCTLSVQGAKTSSANGTTKVIFPGGEIQCFYEPVKAAEVMLQVPNFFLVSTASLRAAGKRISAMKADDELEMNEVYVLLPMKRLNSAVTAADIGALFLAMNSNAVGGVASKVLPECGEDVQSVGGDENFPAANLDDKVEFDQLRYILCRCRSRKPCLETIVEETVNLRFTLMIEN